MENKYFKIYSPKYNILKDTHTSIGYKHTIETKQYLKDNYLDERREFIGNLNKNKTFSPETIEKMRIKALNREPHSLESKLKMIVKVHPIIVIQEANP